MAALQAEERELTPRQRRMCRLIRQCMADFYRCPENERKCQEWKEARESERRS